MGFMVNPKTIKSDFMMAIFPLFPKYVTDFKPLLIRLPAQTFGQA